MSLNASANQPVSASIPIVAIGASEGGVEAVSELLANLPPTTGMAYVFIQSSESPLVSGSASAASAADADPLTILEQATTMPVLEARDQMAVEPNHVYVILASPDRNKALTERDLEVIDGVLTLSPRREVSVLAGEMTIDRFFLSLADRQAAGAIAVLLSGTASDGTLGMRAIRASGGLTFAQDETARFQSMPRSAIIDGVVDRVLPPREIARELEQLSQRLADFRLAAGANLPEKAGNDPAEGAEQHAAAQQDTDVLVPSEAFAHEWVDPQELDGSNVDADPEQVDSVIHGDLDHSTARDEPVIEKEDLREIIQLLRKATGNDFSHYKMTTIRRRIIRRMLLFRFEELKDYIKYLRQNTDELQLLYDDLLINVTTFFRDPETMDYLRQVLLPQLVRNKASHRLLRIWVAACSTGQEAYSIAMLLLEVLGDRATTMTIQLFATDLSEPAVAKARLGSYTRGEVMDVPAGRLQRFFTKVDDHYRINKVVRDMCVFAPHNLLRDPPFSRLDFISCRNLLIYLDAELQRKAMATFHYALNANGHLLLGKSETVGASSPYFLAVETTHKLYTRKNDGPGQALFDLRTRTERRLAVAPPPADGREEPDNTNGNEALLKGTELPAERAFTRRREPPQKTNDLDKAVDTLLSQYVPASVVVNQDLDILQFRGSTGLFLEPAPGRASLNLLKMARMSLGFELRNIIQKSGQSGQPVRRSGLEVKVNDKVHYVAIEAVPFSTEADERLFLVVFEEVRAIVTAEIDASDVRSQRIKQLEEELATLRDDMHSVIEEQEAAHEELQSANEEIISSNEELQSINEELETGKEEIESTNEELLTINQELQVRNDQLSQANAFAEAIFGTIREATLVLTPDLRVKSANPAFYALFGLSESETEGRLFYELDNRQWDIPQLRSLLTDVTTRDVQVQGFELTYQFARLGEKVLSLNARRVVRQQEAILLAIEDITEQRRSQRFLEEREAWFHQIADNAPTLIWVADANGQYTFLNNVWLHFTGGSLADVVTNGWAQALYPDDRASYEKIVKSYFKMQKPFQTEYRLRRHDGNYHWMLENAQPIFSPEGEFTGFIGTAADMQAHKELNAELDRIVAERTQELTEANARLAQTADRLQSVLNGVPASITLMEAVLSADGPANGDPIDFVTAAFNQQAQELLNETADSMPTRSMLQTNPEFRENGLFDTYVAVYKSGQSAYREIGLAVNNQPHHFAVYITRQVDRQGVVVTALDISDRKEAQEQVRKTAEALQAVLDNSPASIALLKAIRTPAGEIVDFELLVGNQRFAQLLGQPIDQLSSLHTLQLAQALWGETTLPNLAHVVETGESYYIEQPRSGQGWLALSVTKQDDGVVITGLDITALKQMQQQREDLLSQVKQSGESVAQLAVLQQQVKLRGELLRTSTHDLRGSLGVIQGAADLLIFADSDEERVQMLEMIQRNVRETTRLITELLDFSRLEAGKQQVVLAPLDAAELLSKLGENIRPLVEGKGLTFHVVGEETLPVVGDAVNILRIGQNIILNALKYTEQGSITLRWGTVGPDEWSFSVEDTGPGMDQAQASQLSQTEKPSPALLLADEPVLGPNSGEGIGLMIVRQLCDLLRGRLLVESQPGQGSVFRIWLPRHY